MMISLVGLDLSKIKWNHLPMRSVVRKSGNAAPNVIRDFEEPVRNHADGKMYSSKRAYRKALREASMIEIGNEKIERADPESTITGQDVADAYDQCEAGNGAKPHERPPEGWE